MVDPNLSYKIEAILFASHRPLKLDELQAILTKENKQNIKEAIQELSEFYNKTNRAFQLVKLGQTYQLETKTDIKELLQQAPSVKKRALSNATMETLSIIAYQQPVTRSQIDEIRGVESSYSIRLLLDRKLVAIAGKAEVMGRPLLYKTTQQFLNLFHFKTIADLPNIQEWKSELAMVEETSQTTEQEASSLN